MTSSRIPGSVRVASLLALLISLIHVVFGAIVRITGSGMGCGDHWPKCYGRWFPPLDRVDLIIEIFHRYLAVFLLVSIILAVVTAWKNRSLPGVHGKGGVLNALFLMLGVAIFAAIFGAITVKVHNAAWATVVHKLIAAVTLAAGTVAVVRSGGFGAASISPGAGTRKAIGASIGAVFMTLLILILGGLTAKLPGAAVACAGFPLCGEGSLGGGGQHVHLTHRIVAYLLVLHLASLPFVFRKRQEASPVIKAAWIAMSLGILQIVWAGWMVTGGFPMVIRSLHQATGMGIWVAVITLFFLAKRAAPDKSGARA